MDHTGPEDMTFCHLKSSKVAINVRLIMGVKWHFFLFLDISAFIVIFNMNVLRFQDGSYLCSVIWRFGIFKVSKCIVGLLV